MPACEAGDSLLTANRGTAVVEPCAENEISAQVIGAAIEVQRHLGAGLVESAYEMALSHELALLGLARVRQVLLAASYNGILLQDAYRLDLLVEDKVVVELKTVEKLHTIHEAQLLTYLRFSQKRLGLLLNFHAMPLKSGIRRVVNSL